MASTMPRLGQLFANRESRSIWVSGEFVDVDDLYVQEAFVNEGPRMKRFKAAAMGRAAPIEHPTCHIVIVVDSKESNS